MRNEVQAGHEPNGAGWLGGLRRFADKAVAALSAVPAQKDKTPFFLSMVVPTYNVEPYIERFLASIFGQSSPMKSFEVIIVDDGSTDRTAEIVRKWEAWFPDHIRYVHQQNAGAAAARNTGMDLARGNWITFPDPDDFLDVNYFREMLKEVKARHRRPLLAVVSHFIFYYEDLDEFSDRHPLRFRFAKGTARKNTNNIGKHLVASMATAWLNREAIERHKLRVDTRVVPAFEDGNFVNRLLISEKNTAVSFVPDAKYYYRKRSSKTSILDTSRDRKEFYLDQLEYGYLPLFAYARLRTH